MSAYDLGRAIPSEGARLKHCLVWALQAPVLTARHPDESQDPEPLGTAFVILGPDFRQDDGGEAGCNETQDNGEPPVVVARGFARSYQHGQTIWSDDLR